jgi:predicted unusual protein kinase regulating ubiquinone biosynthesis (AarF/ABC1/UbiB family)
MLNKINGYVINSYGLFGDRDSRDHHEFRSSTRSIPNTLVVECLKKAMDDIIDNIYGEKPYKFVMVKSRSNRVSLVFRTYETEVHGEMYPTIKPITYINGFSQNTLHRHETLVVWVD